MSPKKLPFTALQQDATRHIEFPLHPQTVDADLVGRLLEGLLDTISRQIDDRPQVSDGDVLQSLCMTLAIRMNMVDAPSTTVRDLVSTLLDRADDAVASSTVQPAGKA